MFVFLLNFVGTEGREKMLHSAWLDHSTNKHPELHWNFVKILTAKCVAVHLMQTLENTFSWLSCGFCDERLLLLSGNSGYVQSAAEKHTMHDENCNYLEKGSVFGYETCHYYSKGLSALIILILWNSDNQNRNGRIGIQRTCCQVVNTC